jgi:hypothetical protein
MKNKSEAQRRKGRPLGERLSLHPLTFDEAVKKLVQTPPPEKATADKRKDEGQASR